MEIALVQKFLSTFFVYWDLQGGGTLSKSLEFRNLLLSRRRTRSAHTCFRELQCCLFPIAAMRGGQETRH